MRFFLIAATAWLSLSAATVAVVREGRENAVSDEQWPQWRGPLGTGVAPHADPPITWSGSDGKNIRWKTPLPGRGHSTPIIWGDRVFVTAAVPYGDAFAPQYSTAPGTHDGVPVTHRHEFVALCLSRRNGKILWQRSLHKAVPHEGGHYTASLASSSAVTDGTLLFVSFGSYGLYCLDFDGDLQWEKHFGKMQTLHGHGEGSSPVVFGDLLVVNWDHENQSFVTALDKRTGEERWKVDRAEVTSWATPIIVKHMQQPQLVISGTSRVRGYNLATGDVLWECGGLSANVVATPVAGNGMVFAGSSYDKRALLAIRLDGARGDITGSKNVVWSRSRGTPYVPSPLLYDDSLYFLTHYQGIMTRVDAQTGRDNPGALRLGGIGNVYASPVGAGGRVYVTDLEGATAVLSHDAAPKVLAVNGLGESISASAAVVGREILLRGQRHLFCIAEP